MRSWARVIAVMFIALAAAVGRAAPAPVSGTARVVLDGNRVYAELTFVRPDGSPHKALAFVDMGSPTMSLNQTLIDELGLNAAHPLTIRNSTRSF